MKTTLLLFLCLTVISVAAKSETKFEQGEAQTQNKRVSPNGKYLVGESKQSNPWGLDGLFGYVSFVQDLETGEKNWITSYDEDDFAKLGSFTDVTDNKVICGVMKDPEYGITITEMGFTYTLPLNVAAVWKDGKVISLGLGTYTTSDFTNFADGSFAMAISNDAKTVVGYISKGNYSVTYPCAWTFNESTNKYDFKQYAIPEDASLASITDVSGDGSIAVGYVKRAWSTYACYWPSPEECIVIDDPHPVGGVQSDGKALAISNNGEFIGLTNNGVEPALYIINSKVLMTFGTYRYVSSLNIGGVTDDGDLFGDYYYSGYGQSRPFWYSANNQVKTDFNYFVYLYANDIELPYKFDFYARENVSFSGVSTDGSIIAGNDTYGKPWILKAEPKFVAIPPTISSVPNTSVLALGEVEVTFERGIETHVWYQAKEYVIYRDGNEVGRIAIKDLEDGATTISFTDKGLDTGTHYYSVAVNFINNNTDTELLSPKSEEGTVYMEENFDFPLFDDFDSNTITSEGWSVQRDYGDLETQFWGCGLYFGLDGSSYLNVGVAQSQPYSFSIVSRHLDARDKKNVYISFARLWRYANSDEWDITKDSLSIEISTNDIEWTVAREYALSEVPPYAWNFEYTDLTSYAAGKTFQVRLRVHGQALAQYIWNFDNLRIDEKPEHEATAGTIGACLSDGAFRVTWRNSFGAYMLNYLGNNQYNVEPKALGNEGKPLIAVNKFDAEEMAMYKGKYLTSVSTQLSYYETEDPTPIRAAIVIYEDGKLIRDQEMIDAPYNEYITVNLDEPMLIDGTKEIMVGLKLLEYGADQIPIIYHNTNSYADGKSNIYSEDDGKTWLNLADYYETIPEHETDGYGSWLITANVTDTPEAEDTEIDLNQYGYQVYKNGQMFGKVFTHYLQGWFNDPTSVQGDTYQVRTFYFDGTVSEISETMTNNGQTGIKEIETNDSENAYMVKDGTLFINGDNDKVALYNVAGIKLYEGNANNINLNNFGKGLLILKVYGKNGNTETYKFMF